MSYASVGAFGQECDGDEVFDAVWSVCRCPSGTQTTGIVGECSSAESVPRWGEQCPSYVPIVRGFQCVCPSGHAYDPAKNMCTKEAMGTGAPPAPPRISSDSSSGVSGSRKVATAGLSTGAVGAGILAGFGLLYLWGQQG